jgi:ribose transport system ATP-binding protein
MLRLSPEPPLFLKVLSPSGVFVSDTHPHILEMRAIVKDFPGVRALDHANLFVRTSEIHGLVGENGAGKSTLIKILAGVYQLDKGEVIVGGETLHSLSPHVVEALGIQFIHQERLLVRDFSIAQSIFLGQEKRHGILPFIDHRTMRRDVEQFLLDVLGVELDGNTLIRDLSVAEAQIVQIAKALIANPSILVFDEPTAPLARKEVESLFGVIHRLKEQGITIIYISHYLQEIAEICDRVTVLRNGVDVGTLDMAHTTTDEIVGLMVGRKLEEMFPTRDVQIGKPILEVDHLSDGDQFQDISFTLHRGEVLGITGLIGSGREALIDTLYGLTARERGQVRFDGQPFRRLSPVIAVESGLALVPRDRRQHGLIIDFAVDDNINLSTLDEVAKIGFLQRSQARERCLTMIDSLDIRTPGPDTIVRYLSGGNQQKVVVGRWLNSEASVYFLDEPTVGIDVGAKIEIYHLINRLVAHGAGVIFVSTEIPELLGMTDRILVMYRGQIIKEFDTCDATADTILAWSTGGQLSLEES